MSATFPWSSGSYPIRTIHGRANIIGEYHRNPTPIVASALANTANRFTPMNLMDTPPLTTEDRTLQPASTIMPIEMNETGMKNSPDSASLTPVTIPDRARRLVIAPRAPHHVRIVQVINRDGKIIAE